MIVWGGLGKVDRLNSGGRYSPTSNRWVNLNVQTNALIQGRRDHTAIWTGTEMIVWGGTLSASREGPPVNTGFQYNPTTDLLVATPIPGAPAPRLRHTAVWTGTEMIIWGGASSSTGIPVNTGARYDPALKRWSPLPAPEITASARDSHTAVWTGNEMIIWGGRNPRPLDTGARFILASNTWVGMPTSGAPDPRFGHSAVWTGKEMIVWGGAYAIDGRTNLDSGGRFSPKQNSWVTTTPLEGAPSPRRGHTAIWTGKEMIVWGGLTNALESFPTSALWTGARFDPEANCWVAINTNAAPHFSVSGRNLTGPASSYHTAVWT